MEAEEKNRLSLADLAFVIGLAAVAVLIPIAIVRLHFLGHGSSGHSPIQLTVGILITLLAAFFVGFNLYTSFWRPWRYRRSHGDYEGYQHVSGAPGLGSILIGLAALFLPSAIWIGVVLLTLYLMDPGGLLVAAAVIIRECFSPKTNNA
jgi:hypothetical protein